MLGPSIHSSLLHAQIIVGFSKEFAGAQPLLDAELQVWKNIIAETMILANGVHAEVMAQRCSVDLFCHQIKSILYQNKVGLEAGHFELLRLIMCSWLSA